MEELTSLIKPQNPKNIKTVNIFKVQKIVDRSVDMVDSQSSDFICDRKNLYCAIADKNSKKDQEMKKKSNLTQIGSCDNKTNFTYQEIICISK